MGRKSLVFFLLLILLGGLWLRIWKLEEFFVFGFDEEVIAFRAKQLLVNNKPFLIGGITPLQVHLGPLFYYFSSLLLIWPWFLNPLSWGVWAAVITTLAIFLIYWVGKEMFNRQVGLMAAFFQAFSFYQVLFDRHYWPLILDPLFSLLVIFSLWQIQKKKMNWVIGLALTLSFAWQTDPTTWPLFILVGLSWWRSSLPLKNKKVILALLIFAFSFVPLILFDLRHQGANIQGLNKLKTYNTKGAPLSTERLLNTLVYFPQGLARLLWHPGTQRAYYHRFLMEELSGGLLALTIFTTLILLVVFKKSFAKKQDSFALALLGRLFLITFLGVIFYGNFIGFDLWNHYLGILFPVFFLMLAWFLVSWWKGQWYVLAPFLLIIFALLNVKEFYQYQPSFSFKNKMAAVSWTKQILGEEEFALESLSQDFRYNGIRYLFYLVNKEPVISFVDPPLFWLYDQEPGGQYPKNFVVFVSQDFKEDSEENQLYQEFLQNTLEKKDFGDIEVLIVNNEKSQFTVSY